MKTYARLEELRPLVGKPIGESEWIEIAQSRIQQFADATDDHQWIHLDVARAEKGPFEGTIAHGFLTLSLLPRMMFEAYAVTDVGMAVNVSKKNSFTPTMMDQLAEHLTAYETSQRPSSATEVRGSPTMLGDAARRRRNRPGSDPFFAGRALRGLRRHTMTVQSETSLDTPSSSDSPSSEAAETPSVRPATTRTPRGFAAMDPNRVREISRLGGKAAHAAGTAHQFSSAEAASAGRKGGRAPHVRRGRGKRTPSAASA